MCLKKAEYIASYIIEKGITLNKPVQNNNLQLILYFIQESFIDQFGEKAFLNPVIFHDFGPMIPDVYYKYCSYGALPIILNPSSSSVDKFINSNSEDKIMLVDKIVYDSLDKNLWQLLEQYKENNYIYNLSKN